MQVWAFQLQHTKNRFTAKLTTNGVQTLRALGAVLSNFQIAEFEFQQVLAVVLENLEAAWLFNRGDFDELCNAVTDVLV
jgi:hypothetical protein